MDQIQIPWVLLAAIGVVATVQTIRLRLRASLPGRRAVRRARRAAHAESAAEPLLRRLGYRVIDRQARVRWRVHVDGAPVDLELRADLIVARRRRRFVAEVKSGTRAPRIAHGATRRQLLEYRLAFDVDGVLLVDPDRGTAHEVRFPPLPNRARFGRAAWLVAGVAIGAIGTWLLIS